MSENVNVAMFDFVENCQKAKNVYFAEHYKNLAPSVFKINVGRKYWKITTITDDGAGQESAFCFVDKKTGDILKAASWKAPAKHARGNVLSLSGGLEALTYDKQYVRYLS